MSMDPLIQRERQREVTHVSTLGLEMLQPASSLHSIVRQFAAKLGVKLNKFNMEDPNTFYLVHGLLKRTYAVKNNPDILRYKVPRGERGKSADELLQRALQKVVGVIGTDTVDSQCVAACLCPAVIRGFCVRSYRCKPLDVLCR